MSKEKEKCVENFLVRLPPFWPEEPEIWFAQVEAQFATSGITADCTKYYMVLQQLDQRTAKEVRDVIVKPPADGKYDKLKDELTKRLSTSNEQKLLQLLTHEELGDRKPSQFLSNLRSLAGTTASISDEQLRTIWYNGLPAHLQEIVAMHSTIKLDDVAEVVDKVLDETAWSSKQVASTSTTSPLNTNELAKLIQVMVAKEVSKLDRNSRRGSHSRSHNSRQISSSRFNSIGSRWSSPSKRMRCGKPRDVGRGIQTGAQPSTLHPNQRDTPLDMNLTLTKPEEPDRMFRGTIDTMPVGAGLEKPLHPRRKRTLPETVTLDESDPVWDSLIVVPDDPATTTSDDDGPSKKARNSEKITAKDLKRLVNIQPDGELPQITKKAMKSEERDFEFVSVEQHQPPPPPVEIVDSSSTAAIDTFRQITLRPLTDSERMTICTDMAVNFQPDDELLLLIKEEVVSEEIEVVEQHQPALLPAIESISTAAMDVRLRSCARRPLTDNEISTDLCLLGSESEGSDGDSDDESHLPAVLVPRAAQMFFDMDVVTTSNAEVDLQWPPSAPPLRSPSPPLPAMPAPIDAEVLEPACAALISGVPHRPTDKFDFDWTAFPMPPVPPEMRREPFVDMSCGPTASYDTPYDAFIAIWDKDIMAKIVSETNEYAQVLAKIMLKENKMCPNSRINNWRDTDIDELYVYFAIVLAMGVVYKSKIAEYWNAAKDIFSTPQFRASMPSDRFLLLNRCLHFASARTPGLNLISKSEAKLFKVQPVIDHLNSKFSSLYKLNQNLALDESLTMWKGWLETKQLIHNKAASAGIKTYEVCESQSGYLWRFEVHAGHEPPSSEGPISAIIPALVLRLVSGLEHRGHTLWMDSYYNSPALARELKSLGFDCVGTLRTDRQLVPEELAKLAKQQMFPGQVVGCTSGDVDLLVWNDKNRVGLISTYHGIATQKCGETTKPTIVHDYNVCMGEVDRKDQMLSSYPIERKRANVWYKQFFKRLLNISVLNSFIMHKWDHNITHRNFRKKLVVQILEKHTKTPPRQSIAASPGTSASRHFAAQYAYLPAAPGKQPQRHRRRCHLCGKRVSTFCQACDVPLCAFECFSSYSPHK